jgi:uncharacterized caspase-like protein
MVGRIPSALVAFCGVIVVTLWTSAARADKRVALVLGNSAYHNVVRLPNPVNDATAIATMFRSAGFEVVDQRFDLGSLELKRAIREFNTMARDADIAVVYFAGHGIEVGGVNYLIPVDAKLATDLDAEDEGVSLDRVIRATEPARRLRLVILDACRDNPFNQKMQRTMAQRAVSSGLAKIELTLSDTMIAYAAKAGSTAEDGSGGNSPFTAALIKYLPEPGVDVRIAFGRVRDEVWARTGHRQEPFVYASLGGAEVPLVPAPPKIAPTPAPVAVENEARRAYELTEKVGTREAWEAFLRDFQTGLYADLARGQLAKLAALPPPPSQAEERAAAARAAAQQREQDARRARAEREAARQRDEEQRAKAAETERQRQEREAARLRDEEAQRIRAAEAERQRKMVDLPASVPSPAPSARQKSATDTCRDLLFRAQIDELSDSDRIALQHCR